MSPSLGDPLICLMFTHPEQPRVGHGMQVCQELRKVLQTVPTFQLFSGRIGGDLAD